MVVTIDFSNLSIRHNSETLIRSKRNPFLTYCLQHRLFFSEISIEIAIFLAITECKTTILEDFVHLFDGVKLKSH